MSERKWSLPNSNMKDKESIYYEINLVPWETVSNLPRLREGFTNKTVDAYFYWPDAHKSTYTKEPKQTKLN